MVAENMNMQTPTSIEPFFLHPSLVDEDLFQILESRYREAHLCLEYSPLATIMLCGSLLEGLLLGIAQKRPKDFNTAQQAPKYNEDKVKQFGDWSLAEFINVAFALKLFPKDAKDFSHTLRNFRNYIHPHQQLNEDFDPNEYTARACLEAVKSAIFHLNQHTATIPQKKKEITTDWNQHPDATHLALAVLIGAWQDKNQYESETVARQLGISYDDCDAVACLLDISYDEWIKKAREILHCPDSPLSITNGTWKVANRAELWRLLGSRVLDGDINRFRALAVSILGEKDPAFELPVEQRFAAALHGKALKYSDSLRKGIAEGLAILGSQPEVCTHCTTGKAEDTCASVVRELLTEVDWVLWGSLNDLLPPIAEAAPDEFLYAVENALSTTPCPFDELFSQESIVIGGCNYLTGLLLALEGLAWDEKYLVRACAVLAELASHDPGGPWSNRPFNSLVNILFPELPKTLAHVNKRNVAVQTLLKEYPDIAWNLIIQLLPNQFSSPSGTHKPSWRKIIPDNWKEGVTQPEEYSQQVSFYAELAVAEAGQDVSRLSTLITHFDNLPPTARKQLLKNLASQSILELPEEKRVLIFNPLSKLIHKRSHLPIETLPKELIATLENIAKQLAPSSAFNLHHHLFTDNAYDFYGDYEENCDLEEQQKRFYARREAAVSEILKQDGVSAIIRLAEIAISPAQVGRALGVVADSSIEPDLLHDLLESNDSKYDDFISSFIKQRFQLKWWKWCDTLDKSDWTTEQIAQFLACLPFTQETWRRASEWLKEHEALYWKRANANAYESDGNLDFAIDKLIEYGKPRAAIKCLDRMHFNKQPIDSNQCVRALLAALSSTEPAHPLEKDHIAELIKFLQTEPSVRQDDLFKVERAYLPLLCTYEGAAPQLLEHKLATDPELFCQIIQLIYRSKKEEGSQEEPSEGARATAANAGRLLHNWKTPPGTQQDGTFSEEHFKKWLQSVKDTCTESGHLDIALGKIGEVLIHTPPDPDGLWIHRAAADALNNKEADNMRDGYRTRVYNSRDAHCIDPTGAPEKELAEQWRRKADEVEYEGFYLFATSLRQLADGYDREAKRVIAQYKQESD